MDLLHHYNDDEDDDDEEEEEKEDKNNNNNDDDHCYEYSNINRIHDNRGRHMMNHDVVIGHVSNNNNNNNNMDLHNTINQQKSFMSPLTSTTTTSGTTKRQRIVESKKNIHHDHNNNHQDVTKKTQPDRIQIVTETEYIAIQKQQDSDTIGTINHHHQPKKKKMPLLQQTQQSQPGRWSTHCSCRITLNQYELRQVDLYIQSLCHIIQDVYPNYIGYAIIIQPPPPFPNRLSSTTTTTTTTTLLQQQQQQHQQRKTKNQSRMKSSSSSASTTEYHISLTRPDVALHTHHIDSFIKSLTYEIQQLSIITPFDISFDIPPPLTMRHCHRHRHRHRTAAKKIILDHHILHNTTRTKSFGIWRCCGNDPPSTTTIIRPLQQLSNCCNHVLTQQYQQVSYHYYNDNDKNNNKNTSNDSNVDQRTDGNHQYQPQQPSSSLSHNRRIDPIYHISLVRFEPCLYEYMNPTMDKTTTNCTIINDDDPINDMGSDSNNDNDDDDDNDSSGDVDTISSDEDNVDDDDTTRNNLHYIDHVTCQFGGGAKVYHIPFSV